MIALAIDQRLTWSMLMFGNVINLSCSFSGSRIISDAWRAYHRLDESDQGVAVYTHDVIVHQRNFVSPQDESVHTQNIENTWQRAKRKLKRQYGTSEELFPSYISEFLWRNKFRNNNLFGQLILSIREFYVV